MCFVHGRANHLPFAIYPFAYCCCCSRFKWLFVNVSISRMKKPPKPIPCSRMKTTKIAAMINHFWNNEQKQKSTPKKKHTHQAEKNFFVEISIYRYQMPSHRFVLSKGKKCVFRVLVVVGVCCCRRMKLCTRSNCYPFRLYLFAFSFRI